MLQDDLEVTIKTVDVDIIVEDVSAIGVEQDPDVLVVFAAPIGPQGAPGFVSLPAQTEVPAAGTILTNVLLRGDPQPAYRLFGSGKMEWGAGGSTAPDLNLYRKTGQIGVAGAGIALRTDQAFSAGGPILYSAASTPTVAIALGQNPAAAGNPNTFFGLWYDTVNNMARIGALSGGVAWRDVLIDTSDLNVNKIKFGTGNANFDVNLYRTAADILKTDDTLDIGNNLRLVTNGTRIYFGSTQDASMYRDSAGVLRTDGAWWIGTTLRMYGGSGLIDFTDLTSTTSYFFRAKQTSDSQYRFAIRADGRQEWGPGGSTATDTFLYRSAVGMLSIGTSTAVGRFRVFTSIAGDIAYDVVIGANVQPSFYIQGNGSHYWGPGNGTADTTLYRSAAGQLKTDGRMISADASVGFYYNPTGDTGYPMYSIIGADSQPKFRIGRTGALEWGVGGSTVMDTTLIRFGPGVLQLGTTGQGGGLRLQNLAGTDNALMVYVQSDSQFRFHIRADGTHWWGPGNLAVDTNLYRSGAGALQTDTVFNAGGTVAANITSLGRWGPGSEPAIRFGGDAVIWRTVLAGYQGVQVDWMLAAKADIYAQVGITNSEVSLGAAGLAGRAGIYFGTAKDAYIYRDTASIINVFGYLRANWEVSARQGTTQQMMMGYVGSGYPGLVFGSAADTNLYRLGAGQLGSDNPSGLYFVSVGGTGYTILAAKRSADTQPRFRIQDGGAGGEAGAMLQWGPGASGVDTNLYRSAAGVLKTDGIINAVGGLQINGVPVSGSPSGYGTTLPASPVDGQEYTLVDSVTNPSYAWRFRYNASSTSPYKWDFVGGPPWYGINGSDDFTTSTAFVDPANNVAFTLPRAGDYLVEWNGISYNVGGTHTYMTANANGSDLSYYSISGGASAVQQTQGLAQKVTGMPAAAVVKLRFKAGDGTAHLLNKSLKVTPIRVA